MAAAGPRPGAAGKAAARALQVVLGGLWLLPRVAHATGPCEDTPRLYGAVLGFAEADGRFAIKVSRSWCDEGRDQREIRGILEFVEVRDLKNGVPGRLASLTGKDARRLERLEGAFEHVKASRLNALLKERGFKVPARSARCPTGRCTVRTGWGHDPDGLNGFPAGKVSVEVREGKRVLERLEAGVAARERRAEVQVHAQFAPAARRLAVLVRVPQCSGPPPGYFGKDDAGTCYRDDLAFTTALDLSRYPALAPCFPAPTSAPTSAPSSAPSSAPTK
jgi:hypothetical protein